jgi:phosphorylcholine metabolism protein LicD
VEKCECDFVSMHGGLIGWYFNGHLLPWDDDVDVIILQNGIKHFVKYDGMETSRRVINE